MVDTTRFEDIVYKFPKMHDGDELPKLIGIDSEAYADGSPFLFCMSDGMAFSLDDIPDIFFTPKYVNRHAVSFNLKYDSGAILYGLPDENKTQLWRYMKTYHKDTLIKYIPKKQLKFQRGDDVFVVWDIWQFFHMSLDKAARIYLNEKKMDVETKKFSRRYVIKNKKRLVDYCIHDAKLAADLGNFLLDKLREFGIRATALYSCASLSFRYFTDCGAFVHVWRYWTNYREAVRFALESYEGGKFEVTARGGFTAGFEYDIVSAYPFEIKNLVDISTARVFRSKKYVRDAVYGYLRCRIDNTAGMHIPCGIMKNVSIYPAGVFYKTITKKEYEYLLSIGVGVSIVDGYWLVVRRLSYPYAPVIDTLMKLKTQYKGKDAALYMLAKIMQNSYYGKMIQMMEGDAPDDTGHVPIKAGVGWNPFYASVITANTRIKVTEMQNRYRDECYGVHTDSVILSRPMDPAPSGRLGDFEEQHTGAGIIVACGQYQIDEKCAWKGIEPNQGDTWRLLLERHPRSTVIRYPQVRAETWLDAVSKRHFRTINRFSRSIKNIDINGDTKRSWPKPMRGQDFLKNEMQKSLPLILIDKKRPEAWK